MSPLAPGVSLISADSNSGGRLYKNDGAGGSWHRWRL